MKDKPTVALTAGDPAGVGPEVVLKALADETVSGLARWIVVGDTWVLRRAELFTGCRVPAPDVARIEDLHQIEGSQCEIGKLGAACRHRHHPVDVARREDDEARERKRLRDVSGSERVDGPRQVAPVLGSELAADQVEDAREAGKGRDRRAVQAVALERIDAAELERPPRRDCPGRWAARTCCERLRTTPAAARS